MNKEQLLQEVLPYLVTYVQDGIVNIAPYVHDTLHVERLADLLKLAIYKQRATREFIEAFTSAHYLHRQNTTKQATSVGEVRGNIAWQPTIHKQLTHSKQHFVMQQPNASQHRDEQDVLSFVVCTLRMWYEQDLFLQSFHTRSWHAPFVNAMPAFMQATMRLTMPQRPISSRAITRMQQHKQSLYRQAAYLYAQIEALMARRYSAHMLQQALTEFFIVPKHTDVLFELYWIVRLIRQQQNVTFYVNDGKTRPIASWQLGETIVTIYHNKAKTPHTQFYTTFHELHGAHPFVQATKAAAAQFSDAAQAMFGRKQTNVVWRGRPDFIVEYVKDDVLTHVVIGEVKYTSSKAYMKQGLAQLLRYMHFMKATSQPAIYGLLCVDDCAPMQYDNLQLLSANDRSTMQLPALEE